MASKYSTLAYARAWRDKSAANVEAYNWFLARAKDYAGLGEDFSVKLLVEEYRWNTRLNASKMGAFKISNCVSAALARLLVEDAPEIAPYITMRNAACDCEGEA